MFDVGFTEVSLIALIALVVIGPKRLPGLARTAGFWVGKARRTLSDVKREIDREMDAAELRDVRDTISDARNRIDDAASDVANNVNTSVNEQVSEVQSAVSSSSNSSDVPSDQPADRQT